MKLTSLHPAGTPNPRINWAAWQASGTLVPPRTAAPRGWGGLLFVAGIMLLIGGPMLWQVMS